MIRDDKVTWQPAFELTRIAAGGNLVDTLTVLARPTVIGRLRRRRGG